MGSSTRPRLCFVVESGTDVRLVDELAVRFELTLLARRIPRGFPVSQPPVRPSEIELGPESRLRFGSMVLHRLTTGRRYDLVLVQGYALAALAANVAALLGRAPAFMLVCSPIEQYYLCRRKSDTPGKRFRFWEYLGLRSLARINAQLGRHYIALSQYLAGVLRAHGTHASIDVIPVYGVDTSVFFPPTDPPAAIRRLAGLPNTGQIIFFSSRFAPEKDGETLLAAFQMLLREGRQLWLLHRSGGYRTFLQQAERLGVADRVIATDARHPLQGLALDYQASDLCVQASREEGLGFSPLEALACRVPVVASAVGGMKETIVDGVTGWTYPVGDVAALARAIASATNDPMEARRRAETGRQLVAEHYERALVFERLEALLRAAV